ncbi:MAG: divergent polysaccharide deacetylase family protein [Methylovirgula sp.]|jgi:uncharacterized protein
MAGDDLHDPLGLDRRRRNWRLPFRSIFLVSLGAALLAGFGWLHFYGNPSGGEPQAVATITPDAAIVPASAATVMPARRHDAREPEKAGVATTTIEDAADLERKSGVKVIRAGGGTAPAVTIIEVPRALDVTLAPAPDPRLVEPSRYGPLPRVGADGARPADVYARPLVTPAAKTNAPRIALLVGGLGLSSSATHSAIVNLPSVVTLAFAPYGKNLPAAVAAARAQGHEVMLQLPMEPIDYPQTNPGPHTLLSTASSVENTDNLHWLLSRFTGYTGVANFLGAKLTADPAAFAPILREIADRGLLYLDDGSSPQSEALTLAATAGLPAAKADVIIDATPDGIDTALIQLEAVARDKGIAIGVASALPESVEKIARFAHAAEANGLVLVPLSAAVGKAAPAVVTSDP